jgi:tetratricopeptide (TPR) repeat protein
MYIYFNQFTGGLRGAYGRYETDYYYIGQTSASEWLIARLDSLKVDSAKVMATFPVDWQFRKKPGITTFYSRNEERSQSEWDYAIVSSRYVEPEKLKKGSWPPPDAIHVVYADGIPVCAVLKRMTYEDYKGYAALEAGHVDEAIKSFHEALKINWSDEMIFYNFARALRIRGLFREADSALVTGLDVNPVCEPILMYSGMVAVEDKDCARAEMYFEKLLKENRKYYDAYTGLADILKEKDVLKARELLRDCLRINPRYVPAIEALADSYRKRSPEVAKKYDELANSIKQINIK